MNLELTHESEVIQSDTVSHLLPFLRVKAPAAGEATSGEHAVAPVHTAFVHTQSHGRWSCEDGAMSTAAVVPA